MDEELTDFQDQYGEAMDKVLGQASLVERWHELARELAEDLPGTWTLRGRGNLTALVQEPWEWTLHWIGFERSAYSEKGWFQAGVEPLIEDKFSWTRAFGLRMDEVRNAPRSVVLQSSDASQVLHDFALGPALTELNDWTIDRFSMAAEKSLLRPIERRKPPHFWMMAPAWRVILNTDSPEAPLLEIIEYCNERQGLASKVPFYTSMLEHWRSGGRDETLSFLAADRDRKIAKAHLTKLVNTRKQ